MRYLKILLFVVLFLLHVAITAMLIYVVGERISKPIDTFLFLLGLIALIILFLTILYHLRFLISKLNNIKNAD